MSQIWSAIWFHRCSMGFISRLSDGQSMTPHPGSPGNPKWLSAEYYLGSGQRCSGRWLLPRVRDFVGTCLYTCWFMVACQHNQLTFATIVKSSQYDDRWTDISILSLHTDFNVFLILRPVHPSSSISVMQLESWITSEDTAVSLVADDKNRMTFYPLTAAPTMH